MPRSALAWELASDFALEFALEMTLELTLEPALELALELTLEPASGLALGAAPLGLSTTLHSTLPEVDTRAADAGRKAAHNTNGHR